MENSGLTLFSGVVRNRKVTSGGNGRDRSFSFDQYEMAQVNSSFCGRLFATYCTSFQLRVHKFTFKWYDARHYLYYY